MVVSESMVVPNVGVGPKPQGSGVSSMGPLGVGSGVRTLEYNRFDALIDHYQIPGGAVVANGCH
jgi:hypothetical protein